MLQALSISLISVAVGSTSLAQYSVCEESLEMATWTFTPIMLDNNNAITTEAFLAMRHDAAIQGENIASVLYIRNNGMPTGWETLAWDTQDQWEAIEWLKSVYDIPGAQDGRWQTHQQRPASPEPVAPSAFENGLLEGDVFAPIIAVSPNQGEIIEMLDEIGYPAADVPTENTAFDAATPEIPLIGLFALAIDTGDVQGEGMDIIKATYGFSLPFCVPVSSTGPPSTPTCGAPTAWGVVQTAGASVITCTYSRSQTCTQGARHARSPAIAWNLTGTAA